MIKGVWDSESPPPKEDSGHTNFINAITTSTHYAPHRSIQEQHVPTLSTGESLPIGAPISVASSLHRTNIATVSFTTLKKINVSAGWMPC
jgi:hypothetical protein